MNNHIAEKLSTEVRNFFGSKVEPLSLFKACHDSIVHMEELSLNIYRLNSTITDLKMEISAHKLAAIAQDDSNNELRIKNKRLQNKLTVANHKCSAYKSILKDAIK